MWRCPHYVCISGFIEGCGRALKLQHMSGRLGGT
jgi:hypothetical protein